MSIYMSRAELEEISEGLITAYSGIGRERLRKLTSQEECPFVLHIGNRRMIKRRIFDEYIEKLTFLE